jgi:hypothetical protein
MTRTPWLTAAVTTAANVMHDGPHREGGVIGPMSVADVVDLAGSLDDLLARLAAGPTGRRPDPVRSRHVRHTPVPLPLFSQGLATAEGSVCRRSCRSARSGASLRSRSSDSGYGANYRAGWRLLGLFR